MLNESLFNFRAHFPDSGTCELRAQHNASRQVMLLSGQLVSNQRSDRKGVSARVRKNGVYGFSSTGTYSEDAVKRTLKEAEANASFLEKNVQPIKGPLAPIPTGQLLRNDDAIDVEQTFYIERCRELDDFVVQNCPELVSRVVGAMSDTVEKVIAVSDGLDAHVVTRRSYLYIKMVAMHPESGPVELYDIVGGYGTFDQHFSDLSEAKVKALEIYEELMKKREGVHPKPGKKTCVLSGALAGMLAHEAVGHTVEADLVISGSVSAHLLNQPVASEITSLVDYAHTAFGKPVPLPVFADDEGVTAKDTVLIENGILKGYMNNRESARHFGVEPTGHARAWLFSDEPLIRMRNTVILPGKNTLEEMLVSIDDGYWLISSNNGQADMTGEFMFGVTRGYEIKNGKIGRAILDTTISGIAFEMMKTIDMLSDTVEWGSAGFCGKKQPMAVSLGGPAVRCEITVGGRM